jgi:CheY-like chemotaxis protein
MLFIPEPILMPSRQHFLCIEADADGRLWFVQTLRRIFPAAEIVEARDYQAALTLLGAQTFDAIVARRASGADPETLIRGLREAAPDVPILAVSGKDRAKELLAAGATQFLPFDSWLLVGTTVAAMLETKNAEEPAPRGELLSDR